MWTPVAAVGVVRYRVARFSSGWTVVTSVPVATTTATITRQNGVSQYAIFTEYANGEILPSPFFFISK